MLLIHAIARRSLLILKRTFSHILLISLFWITSTVSSFAAPTSAQITYRGVFDCFDASLSQPQGDNKPTVCETSAIISANGILYTASDRPIPGASSVMTLNLDGDVITRSGYVEIPTIGRLKKAEDFAVTPRGNRVFLASAFNRVAADSSQDAFNTVLTWKVGKEDKALVIDPTGEPPTSVSLRAPIQKVLSNEAFPDGPPYFKIEGMASLPGKRLLFGVREIGQDYSHFDYAVKIIATKWKRFNPLHLSQFKQIYEYDPQNNPQIDHPVGLSSLAWDAAHEQLLLLTSFELEETDVGLGAYLWTLPLDDLEQQNPPTLITKADGEPLMFAHKAEGITILPDGRLLVIHDDDRVIGDRKIENPETEFYREPYQGAYTLVEWIE